MSPAQCSWKGSHWNALAIQLIGMLRRLLEPHLDFSHLSSLLACRNRRLKALLCSGITANDNSNIILLFVGRLSLSLRVAGSPFSFASSFCCSLFTTRNPGTRGDFPKFKADVLQGKSYSPCPPPHHHHVDYATSGPLPLSGR